MTLNQRLSTMMFLQYAIWGSWFYYLATHMQELNLAAYTGQVYSTMNWGCIIAIFAGQLADRWFSTEKVLGASHLAGALLLFWVSTLNEAGPIFWVLFAYAVIYFPTIGFSNSISFRNLPDAQREFGKIRVFGSVGWIFALLANAGWHWATGRPSSDFFVLGGLYSLICAAYCFTLPHTPPIPEETRKFAPLALLKHLGDRTFLTMMIVAFILTIFFTYYFSWQGQFIPLLIDPEKGEAPWMGVPARSWVGIVDSMGTATEFIALPLLPLLMARVGLKNTFLIGIGAWVSRYLVFGVGEPRAFVILSYLFHGFCFAYVYVVAQLYVDSVVEKDLRASAQTVLNAIMLGVGPLVGNYVGQFTLNFFKGDRPEYILGDYNNLYFVAAVGCIGAALIFWPLFRNPRQNSQQL